MSRRLIYASIGILGWSAASLAASSGGFSSPVLGFVYSQSSHTVRPLLGVAGAAQIGSPVLAGVDFASVAPDGRWALVTKAGVTTFVSNLSATNSAEYSADGLIAGIDRVLWNGDGSIALVYSSARNQLQRVRLSAGTVTAETSLDLSAWGTAAALAIDPAGQQIAFGIKESGLYLCHVGQSPALLSSMAMPTAVAFDGTGERLFAVDLDSQMVTEFDSGSQVRQYSLSRATPTRRLPLKTGSYVGTSAVKPVGLTVTSDGRYLLIADSASQAVLVYEADYGRLVRSIALDFAPSRFEGLSSAHAFLLNGENSSQWLMVLNADQSPGISFVPAKAEELQ
jgi:hypothetical protein